MAGIAYVVCVLGGHIAHSGAGGDQDLSAYSEYLADDGRMQGAATQAVMAIIGLAALLVFASGFIQRNRDAHPGLATLASGAAVAYGVLWTVGVALITAAGFGLEVGGTPAITPEAAQAADFVGSYLLYFAGLSVAGVWVLASVRLGSLAGTTGPWLTRYGYVAGVALLPGFIWVGLPLHMVWVLIVSVSSLRG